MTYQHDGRDPAAVPSTVATEQSQAVLRAILAGEDPATWYPNAPKIPSRWESGEFCDLRGVDLSHQRIGEVMLAECILDDADFRTSVLHKTSLQATSASRARFTDATLHLTQMIPFYGEHVDFTRTVFNQAFIQYAKLLESTFTSARLDNVSFSHTDVSRSSFVGAQVVGSRLDSAMLTETDLTQARFEKCDLVWAVFQHAQMSGTLIQDSDMSGADFRGARLHGARIVGGSFGVVQQGAAFTPTRFDDTPTARKIVADSGATGIGSIEWHPVDSMRSPPPGNAAAGQPCPRSGFWFTPARPGSRRHFRTGENLPEVTGDYGATIWQWDHNQDPPKL